MNRNIIDPRTYIRIWTVTGKNWSMGEFKSFWLKKNALIYADLIKNNFLFVILKNEVTGKEIKLKNNPENQRPKPIICQEAERTLQKWEGPMSHES